jgi:hypothetical protein
MILPNEILLDIYDYSDIQTKIKLNKVFKWSFYSKNPFHNLDFKGTQKITNRIASYRGHTFVLH